LRTDTFFILANSSPQSDPDLRQIFRAYLAASKSKNSFLLSFYQLKEDVSHLAPSGSQGKRLKAAYIIVLRRSIGTRGKNMVPKYAAGNKVRIKSRGFLGKILDPNIEPYANMEGEIIETTSVVGFVAERWSNLNAQGGRITIYEYAIKLNDEIILRDVLEECLERIG
jgi:hypothetical protein